MSARTSLPSLPGGFACVVVAFSLSRGGFGRCFSFFVRTECASLSAREVVAGFALLFELLRSLFVSLVTLFSWVLFLGRTHGDITSLGTFRHSFAPHDSKLA